MLGRIFVLLLLPGVGMLAQTPPAAKPVVRDPRQSKVSAMIHDIVEKWNRDHDAASAIHALMAVREINPKSGLTFYNLGIVAEYKQDWASAATWFGSAISLAPAGAAWLPNAKAKAAWIQALIDERDPGKRAMMMVRRRVQEAMGLILEGRAVEGAAAAQLASGMDGAGWEATALAGASLAQLGSVADAAALFRKAATTAPPVDAKELKSAAERLEKEVQLNTLLASARAEAAKPVSDATLLAQAKHFEAAWKLFPELEEWGVAASGAYLEASAEPHGREIAVALEASRNPLTVQRAKEIRLQYDRLAFEATSRAAGSMQPPQFRTQSTTDLVAELGAAESAADGELRAALDAGRQQQEKDADARRKLADLETEIEAAEEDARSNAQLARQSAGNAQDLANQSTAMASQGNLGGSIGGLIGAIGSASIKKDAEKYQKLAAAASAKARDLRKKANSLAAELGDPAPGQGGGDVSEANSESGGTRSSPGFAETLRGELDRRMGTGAASAGGGVNNEYGGANRSNAGCASCGNSPRVVQLTAQCKNGSMSACYLAAAELCQCNLNNGGCGTSASALQQCVSQNTASAQQLRR